MQHPWYATWFNTHFYHDLYQHRDEHEARGFIRELCQRLGVQPGETALDMACGRGRHAKVLSEQGLDVLGVDLSEESISFARQFEHDDLKFSTGNMLETLPFGPFDWVFNLFTSFGYFENDQMHQQAIDKMAEAVVPGGRLVLDYMNSVKIAANLVPANDVQTDLAHYSITRIIDEGTIVKRIRVHKDCEIQHFEERVRAFTPTEMTRFMEHAGLEVLHIKGDYDLSDFEPEQSNRMIIIAKKPA